MIAWCQQTEMYSSILWCYAILFGVINDLQGKFTVTRMLDGGTGNFHLQKQSQRGDRKEMKKKILSAVR